VLSLNEKSDEYIMKGFYQKPSEKLLSKRIKTLFKKRAYVDVFLRQYELLIHT